VDPFGFPSGERLAVLGAQVGATVPILRPQFALGELGDLYRPAALTFRTALGVGVVIE
jgi:hypothetical protein